MSIIENIKMSLKNLRANKLRSFLTMLGIIIGISSVITIVALGNGGTNNITGEFEKMGATKLNLTVDRGKASRSDYINMSDIETIREKAGNVQYISPTLQNMGVASWEDVLKDAAVTGGNEELALINGSNMVYGRFFNKNEVMNEKPVAVIDENSANALFGYSDAVGKNLMVGPQGREKKVTIIGISESQRGGNPLDEKTVSITLPVTFMQKLYSDQQISAISFTSVTKEDVDLAGNQVINILENRHQNRGSNIYEVTNMLNMLDQINNILGIMTTFISAVAAISLLVGGIGVMNIMLVSVTERTREIGIRKALGATTKTILIQFLMESLILALIGGIIGMLLGIAGAQLIGMFVAITPQVSLTVIIGTILFSSAIGIFFGIYPAKQASKLHPIDALRYE